MSYSEINTRITNKRSLRLPQVREITGLSTPTIYRYIKQGLFPKQHRVGLRAVAWSLYDIELWLEKRFGDECDAKNN